MEKSYLYDKRLSLKAKGLLVVATNMPSDHKFSVREMISISKEGKEAIYKALDELKRCGYLVIDEIRGKDGRMLGNEYRFLVS